MKEETQTVAVRLPLPVYNTLCDMLEWSEDYNRMSDLLRAIISQACVKWVESE